MLQRMGPITQPKSIPVHWELTEEDLRSLTYGHQAHAMEDKWNIYTEQGIVHFHRSWTGAETFRFSVDRPNGGLRVTEFEVEKDPQQYKLTDEDQIQGQASVRYCVQF